MAKMPMPAKTATAKTMPPAADDTDDDEAAGGEGEGGDEENDDEDSDVLLTVLKNKDGTYELIEGDEDEDEDEGGGEDEEGEDEEGEESEKPEGETFDSKGALLKGILDLLNKDEEGGEGSDDENFKAGFEGGSEASPAKPPSMAQKY